MYLQRLDLSPEFKSEFAMFVAQEYATNIGSEYNKYFRELRFREVKGILKKVCSSGKLVHSFFIRIKFIRIWKLKIAEIQE